MPPLSHLTSYTPTKSNLYPANSLAAAESEPSIYGLLTFQVSNIMSLLRCLLVRTKVPVQVRGFLCEKFRKKICFYGEELLAPRPTPKLEYHPLSAVHDCLFNIFAATLHIGSRSFHPKPEDAPCRGDRDPLITACCDLLYILLCLSFPLGSYSIRHFINTVFLDFVNTVYTV